MNKHYVKAVIVGGRVKGYAVYDGADVVRARFTRPDYETDVALHLANAWRDDANAEAEIDELGVALASKAELDSMAFG